VVVSSIERKQICYIEPLEARGSWRTDSRESKRFFFFFFFIIFLSLVDSRKDRQSQMGMIDESNYEKKKIKVPQLTRTRS
jgi:hypothetical protein